MRARIGNPTGTCDASRRTQLHVQDCTAAEVIYQCVRQLGPNDRAQGSFAFHVAQLALSEHPDTLDWLTRTKFPAALITRLQGRPPR